MKSPKFFIILVTIIITFNTYADYVYTPFGEAVYVFESGIGETQAHRDELTSWLIENYSNAIVLSEGTEKYNCHHYAWYMTEGHPNSYYWMNPWVGSYQPNVSKFWTNDAFVETTGGVYDKIVYYDPSNTIDANIQHSAVVSTVPGYYESKWGSLPLVRHLPDYVPPTYGTTKRYFKPIPPTPIYGLITCGNGNGTIGVNVSANYYATIPTITTNSIWSIEDNHLEDAIAEGEANINNVTLNSATISFSRVGVYEIYLKCYNKYNELAGEYNIQSIVSY